MVKTSDIKLQADVIEQQANSQQTENCGYSFLKSKQVQLLFTNLQANNLKCKQATSKNYLC